MRNGIFTEVNKGSKGSETSLSSLPSVKSFGLLFLVLIGLALLGCAQTHNKASTAGAAAQQTAAGVRGDVVTTRNAVTNSQASTARAQVVTAKMGKNLDQAEGKNVLIRRWFELNEKFIWLFPSE